MTSPTVHERSGYIGGSDFIDILSVAPYGCQRKLWMEKRGLIPPVEETNAMRRGTFGEDAAVEEYYRQTGRAVRRKKYAGKGHFGAHIDRHIVAFDDRGPGVLEVKCPGEFPFKKIKREGLHEGYIAQLQWGMARTGWNWGSFAIMHLDSWELLWWDIARDNALIERLEVEANDFWGKVEAGTPPDKFSHKDSRCVRCKKFGDCHEDQFPAWNGEIAQDDSLVPLIAEFTEAKEIADDAGDYLESIKDRLKTTLGERQVVDTSVARIYFATQERRGYTVAPGKSRPLRIFPK